MFSTASWRSRLLRYVFAFIGGLLPFQFFEISAWIHMPQFCQKHSCLFCITTFKSSEAHRRMLPLRILLKNSRPHSAYRQGFRQEVWGATSWMLSVFRVQFGSGKKLTSFARLLQRFFEDLEISEMTPFNGVKSGWYVDAMGFHRWAMDERSIHFQEDGWMEKECVLIFLPDDTFASTAWWLNMFLSFTLRLLILS